MAVTLLTGSDGKVTTIKGGVAHVVHQPEKPPATVARDADEILVDRLTSLGLTEALKRVAELDPDADAETLVIMFFRNTGVVPVLKLFEKAFPDVDIEASEQI